MHLKNPNERHSLRPNNEPFILQKKDKPGFHATLAAFSYKAPEIWNDLPKNLRTDVDEVKFKRSLKTHFYDRIFYYVANL